MNTIIHENIVTVAGQHFRKASWPRRIVARLIDVLLVATICALSGSSLLLFTLLLSIIYLSIGNSLLAGRSIGKRLTGLKAIDARHGCPVTPIQDLVRCKYILVTSPIFLALNALDESRGCFDKPEAFVVMATPLQAGEIAMLQEKPAKLDLEGMRRSILKRPEQ